MLRYCMFWYWSIRHKLFCRYILYKLSILLIKKYFTTLGDSKAYYSVNHLLLKQFYCSLLKYHQHCIHYIHMVPAERFEPLKHRRQRNQKFIINIICFAYWYVNSAAKTKIEKKELL